MAFVQENLVQWVDGESLQNCLSSLYHLCMLTKNKQTLWILNRSGSCTLLSCNWWYCFSHMLVLHPLVPTLKNFCCKQWLPTFCLKKQWIWQYTEIWNCGKNDLWSLRQQRVYFSWRRQYLRLFHDFPGMKECRQYLSLLPGILVNFFSMVQRIRMVDSCWELLQNWRCFQSIVFSRFELA